MFIYSSYVGRYFYSVGLEFKCIGELPIPLGLCLKAPSEGHLVYQKSITGST